MKSAALGTAETAFISMESFTPTTFKRWVERRPAGDINRYELASGRIIMTPPAAWEHAEIEARIIRVVGEFVATHRLGRMFGSSAGHEFPSGDTLEPDASFISRERWAKGPQPRRGQFLKIVPSLVVEITSPATSRRDRIEKKKLYETNGVEEYWLVDPNRREVAIFNVTAGKYGDGRRFQSHHTLRSKVLTGFEVITRIFFA
jgi:Uma2 family endonuclease